MHSVLTLQGPHTHAHFSLHSLWTTVLFQQSQGNQHQELLAALNITIAHKIFKVVLGFVVIVNVMRQSHIGARCDQTVEHVLELGAVTVPHTETVSGEKTSLQRTCSCSLFLRQDHLQDQPLLAVAKGGFISVAPASTFFPAVDLLQVSTNQ